MTSSDSIFAKIKNLGWKRTFALFLLAAIDVLVIASPYYLKNFVPNIHLYLGVEEQHTSYMTAIIGIVTLITQLPGGYLADKFSSKKLIFIGGILTALMTVWYATLILIKDNGIFSKDQLVNQYYIIYAIWGISSTPFFWTPLWKLVSQQVDAKNQGFAYGLQGSLNGVFGLVFVFAGGIIVTSLAQKYGQGSVSTISFATYIYLFAIILAAVSVGILFFVREFKSEEKFGISPKELFRAMSDWKVWALSLFVLGMYMFQSTLTYYFLQMLTNSLRAPAVLLTVIGGIRLYGLRFVISTWVGKFSDKLNSIVLFLVLTLFVGILIVAIALFLPGVSLANVNTFSTLNKNYQMVVIVVCITLFLLSSVLSWIMVTLRYTQANEIVIPKNSSGAVIAIMSFIGFSSDSWFYAIGGAVSTHYKVDGVVSQTGYQIIIALAIVVSLIGLLAGFAVYISNYKFLKKHNINFLRVRGIK